MSGAQTIKAWLSHPQTKDRIDQALMGYLPGDAFAEQCIMVSRDPALAQCAPDSLLTAFLSCAQLGLLPGPQKLVQLIPRRGHDWDPFAEGRAFESADDLKGGYIEATLTDGSKDWHYVTKAEIDKVRQCARSQNIWSKWFKEMAHKTLYRQAWARMFLPSTGLTHVNEAIDQAERLDRIQHREDPNLPSLSPAPQLSSPVTAAITYEAETVDTRE